MQDIDEILDDEWFSAGEGELLNTEAQCFVYEGSDVGKRYPVEASIPGPGSFEAEGAG
jgi:hypothetical protein